MRVSSYWFLVYIKTAYSRLNKRKKFIDILKQYRICRYTVAEGW